MGALDEVFQVWEQVEPALDEAVDKAVEALRRANLMHGREEEIEALDEAIQAMEDANQALKQFTEALIKASC